MKYKSHYDYLEAHLDEFSRLLGLPYSLKGLISAHGDKFYGYQDKWEKAGIPFEKGAAICLLTYIIPYSNECRETKNGWVKPCDWVISNKDKFMKFLP